jgi:hypothetical protein
MEEEIVMATENFGLAKIYRLGMMIRQMLSEQGGAPLDADAVKSLTDVYRQAVQELEDALPEELIDELGRLSVPFEQPDGMTESEVRMANAQLLGWLDGVTQGVRMALMAQAVQGSSQDLGEFKQTLPPAPPQDEPGYL